MKIISLNIWGGRAGKEKLLAFLKNHRGDTDVFCLQEVWKDDKAHRGTNLLVGGKPMTEEYYKEVMNEGVREIAELLPEYTYFFHPNFGESWGLMLLVKKDIEVLTHGEVFVHKHKEYMPEVDYGENARNIQYVLLREGNSDLMVVNFHGLWNGKGKTDSEDRLLQSENIASFLKTVKGEVVLCGDFNLLPETESIAILERAGLRNLIREYNIPTTRTELYDKKVGHADYVFVSKGLTVKKFEVLPDVVSDHAPLVVEVNFRS